MTQSCPTFEILSPEKTLHFTHNVILRKKDLENPFAGLPLDRAANVLVSFMTFVTLWNAACATGIGFRLLLSCWATFLCLLVCVITPLLLLWVKCSVFSGDGDLEGRTALRHTRRGKPGEFVRAEATTTSS